MDTVLVSSKDVEVAKEAPAAGVDTPEDLEAVRAIVAKQAQ